jgi:hypothetical protein
MPLTSLHSEDGGSKVIRNVVILSKHYMSSQTRGPRTVIICCFSITEVKRNHGNIIK